MADRVGGPAGSDAVNHSALAVAAFAALAALAGCNRPSAPAVPETPVPEQPAPASTAATVASASTLAARPSGRDDASRDTRALPNAFRAEDTLGSLQSRFGKDNVRVENIQGAEGEVSRGICLFPYDPARRAYLHFADEEQLLGLSLVRIVDRQSAWTLGEDIRMGTTLAELVARNGAPIDFSGFGWDYGGAIAGFHGGTLEPRANAWPRPGFRLAPREDLGERMLQLPQGDATFASDDPAAASHATEIVVGELTLAFPRQANTP